MYVYNTIPELKQYILYCYGIANYTNIFDLKIDPCDDISSACSYGWCTCTKNIVLRSLIPLSRFYAKLLMLCRIF